jgi:hypothetical protein
MPRSVAVLRPARLRAAALVALALSATAVAPGCTFFRSAGRTLGLISAPQLELTESVPPDFELVVKVTDQLDPAADYTIWIRRNGKCDYRAEVRYPRRRVSEGPFEILENQVQDVWDLIRQAAYTGMEERYPDSGEGSDRALGVQAYSVRGNDLHKEVQAHFMRVPELEAVRTLVLSYLPPKALADTGRGDPSVGKSKEIIGDMKTKIFYPADDKRLDDVPMDRRQPFRSWQDALNYDYRPVEGFQPGE